MVIYGMRKIIKKEPMDRALNKYLPEIINAIFLFGKVGSGKTTTMWSLLINYFKIKKYKCFILWGGERDEQLYLTLPNRELSYWDKIKKIFPGLKGEGPFQSKVHLIYFYCDGKMPKKLPNNPPYVKSSVVTIPYKKVNAENIMHAMGVLSSSDESVWRECLAQTTRNDGPAKLEDLAKDITKKNQIIYRNFVKPLCDTKLLQSNLCSYNLDLLQEFRDRDTFTIFCFDFVPEEYKIFALEWVLSQMVEILDKYKGMTRNLMAVNEAAEFFRADDDSVMPDRYKIFRKSLSNYVRYGRRGLKFVFNCQSPNETKGLVSGQDDYTLLCKMTSAADIDTSTEHLRKANLIRKDQVDMMYRLKPGQFFFCESGKPAVMQYYFKPKTMYWEPGVGNFYDNTWKKYVDKWCNIENVTDEINKQYNEEKEKLLLIKKEKILKKPDMRFKVNKQKLNEDVEEDDKNEISKEFVGEGIMREEKKLLSDENFELPNETEELNLIPVVHDNIPLQLPSIKRKTLGLI